MTEIHLDFLNFNNILLLLIILAIGGYLYYEIHKMKLSMNDIQRKLNFLVNRKEEYQGNIQSTQSDKQIISDDSVIPNVKSHFCPNSGPLKT